MVVEMWEMIYNYENVIYCPSNIYLKSFVDCDLQVGAQDVSFYENGAYTGDVSSSQLSSLGVKYVIIGHSERRMYYDDSKRIYNKLDLSLKEGLIPILCIGEKKEDYLNKKTLEVLEEQLEVLNDIDISKVIVAYEPIWAIGTGIIPSNEEIYKVINYIKTYLNNNNMTMTSFGKLFNVTRPTVKRWIDCDCVPELELFPAICELVQS